MDFYSLFEDYRNRKAFKVKDLAELTGKSYDAFRMAISRKSLTELEKRTISEKYFGTEHKEISVNEPHEFYYVENKNSNQFLKLENGQYLMTMPLAEITIQAGFLDHYQDLEYLNSLGKHSIIVDNPVKGRYVAFRVNGDSMDDGSSKAILPNSIVTTRELQRQHWTSKIRYRDFPFWVIYTSESRYPLLKEISEHDVENGIITCRSLNDAPEYTDFQLSLNKINALFYVVDVQRSVSKQSYY